LAIWYFYYYFLIVVGVGVWVAIDSWRLARNLDLSFNPLGLNGKPFLYYGRQYHGTIPGRLVDAYFHREPSLDFYIACDVNTRLGIGLKGRYSHSILELAIHSG
jgi:hypothetical protein